MAYGYWKNRMQEREAVFHIFFRKNPFQSGYSIACGLADVIDCLHHLALDKEERRYLETLTDQNNQPLFGKDFLDYLQRLNFSCDVDAVPEGTVVFPDEPVIRVRGPLLQAQLLETILLNLIGFQTLIATKASRICTAAAGDPIIEFGLRRAQGINGAMAASRAAYIGGCTGTSNVLAGMRYGIPVMGTHAHSWIMAFNDEKAAFEAYARTLPNNCIFLVDTYDTLAGVRNAIHIAKNLQQQGYKALGIRLDSGDLAYLSIETRRLLDEAGFPEMKIVATNELDEYIITSLKAQGAKINIWGVGTKLVTSYDEPALGCVYKLGAIKQEDGNWSPRLKLSEQLAKMSTPGILQTRRFRFEWEFIGDMIYNEAALKRDERTILHPTDITRSKTIPAAAVAEDLLIPVFRKGKQVYPDVDIQNTRQHAANQLQHFHSSIKRLLNPHEYPVGLEAGLHRLKTDLIAKWRKMDRGWADFRRFHEK